MQRIKIVSISFLLLVIILLTTAFNNAAPPSASALVEGRTYDQAHGTGYIDWSGTVGYVQIIHKDGSYLPPGEGGASCAPRLCGVGHTPEQWRVCQRFV